MPSSWTTPRTGFGTAAGFGVETTYGTPVSRTNWLRVISTNVRRNIGVTPLPTLGKTGDTSRMIEGTYASSDSCTVEFETIAAYDDTTLLLLTHAMGAVSTSGSGPYDHDITLADRADGLTLEHIVGNGNAEIVEGLALTGFTARCANGEPMRIQWRGIGETSTAGQSPGTPSYSSAGNPILFSQAGSVSFNSVNYSVLSLEIAVDNNQQERRQLASVQTLRPIGVGYRSVRVRITQEYMNDAPYAAYIARTQSDLAVTFTGTGNNAAVFTLQNAQISDYTRQVSGPGVITETIEFIGQTDGTDLGLDITITNDNSAATAN